MRIYSLDEVYADPRAAILRNDREDHRARVRQALAPEEPIHAYWWDRDITGLVLFTDRRILQFPRFARRKELFGFTYDYDTWEYPYPSLSKIEAQAGSLLELPRIVLHRHQAEDALIILNGGKREERDRLVGTLRALIDLWKETAHPPAPEHETLTDTAMQLRELYDLYQAGALNEDEYRRAKARLLAD